MTVGNNAVPGEVNYGSPTAQFQAGVGYDMASGLGSVNVTNLVTEWNTFTFNPTTTTLALGQTTGITHGSSVSVNIGVAPSSGTGTSPTGDVSLLATSSSNGTALGFFTLSSGAVVSSVSDLPGGSYSVYANYAGDTNYSASTSSQVPVTVTPEGSTTMLSVLGFNANGTSFPFQSGPFGSFVYLRADVAGLSEHGTPTGSVTFTDTFGAIPGGNTFTLNSGEQFQHGSNATTPNGVLTFDTGTHNISASYSGDASFNPSSSAAPIQFSIQPGFLVSIGAAQSTMLVSAPGSSGSTSMSVAWSTGFSGTISFSCSGLPAGAACAFIPASLQATSKFATNTATINVTTTAGTTTSALRPMHRWHTGSLVFGFMLFSIVSMTIPQRRRSSFLLVAVFGLMLFAPGCGGGSSGGGGGSQTNTPPPPTPTPTGSYNVTVSATSGSSTSTTGFTLVVQ